MSASSAEYAKMFGEIVEMADAMAKCAYFATMFSMPDF